MIQRIQTLFLLGIAICMGVYIALPHWEKISEQTAEKMSLDAFGLKTYVMDSDNTWSLVSHEYPYYVAIFAALSIIVALYSVFQYKNRLVQIKLSALIALLIMITVGISVYIIYSREMDIDPGVKVIPEVGFFLPLVALILNSLANRFIRKDEKLVKSVDRIR